MPDSAVKPIEIFRAGTQTASDGTQLTFSEADLAAAASAYDPALHEAPLVIGHPKATAPAYGWVGGLKAEGGSLFATPRQVNADFAELVTSGAFKKLSASFYLPGAAANPKPGVYYLRHVGFLGAQPPAIKGLAPVEFAESDDTITVEFAETGWRLPWVLRSIASMFRGLRDNAIATQGVESADKLISDYDITDIERAAADMETAQAVERAAEPTSNYSEPSPKEVTVTIEPDMAAEAAKLKADMADFAEQKAVFAKAQNNALLDAIVAEGRPLPCDKAVMLDFMAAIAEAGTVNFGETGDQPALHIFKSQILAKLPKQVDFSERAPGGSGDVGEPDPATLAREAVAYQETMRSQGVVIGTTEAVSHVSKERTK